MFQKDSKKWVEALLQGIQERKKERNPRKGRKEWKERKGKERVCGSIPFRS